MNGDITEADQDHAAILEWLAGDDTGASSRAMAYDHLASKRAFGDRPTWEPADASDLGRCLRLIARVPAVRASVDRLAMSHQNWAVLAPIWDDLAAALAECAGPDFDRHKCDTAARRVTAMIVAARRRADVR